MRFLQQLWFYLLVSVSLIWLGGYLHFIHEVRVQPNQAAQKADAIVVLTGTTSRLKEGYRLLSIGAGERLLISGVNRGVSKETLRQAMDVNEVTMNCCIDIGKQALDTVGNADEISLWAAEREYSSLLVVTSAYHMPRSLVEIRRMLPKATLLPVPAQDKSLNLENWWQNPKSMYILAAEFNKFLFSLIRARTESAVMSGDSN